MKEVAQHYMHFGGVSPINAQNRELIAELKKSFSSRGIELPIYFGNRNWHPLLPETIRQMKQDGVRRALAFFTSAYSCYSGCRQYRENIRDARQAAGESAPRIDKLRMFFNHPDFIDAAADRVRSELDRIPLNRRHETRLVFTAHSIPLSMAEGCKYEAQLRESSRLVAEKVGGFSYDLVYQSRSGPPSQPWLGPDVCDYIADLPGQGCTDLVVMPIGFLSDHMEVLFDLDIEAREAAEEAGLNMHRAKAVGTHPSLIRMIGDLVLERINGSEKAVVGQLPASHDVCPENCCLPGAHPLRPVTPSRSG